MTRRIRHLNFRSERGQAMTEFALVLPVLALLLFAIIQFGIVFHNYVADHRRDARRRTQGRGQPRPARPRRRRRRPPCARPPAGSTRATSTSRSPRASSAAPTSRCHDFVPLFHQPARPGRQVGPHHEQDHGARRVNARAAETRPRDWRAEHDLPRPEHGHRRRARSARGPAHVGLRQERQERRRAGQLARARHGRRRATSSPARPAARPRSSRARCRGATRRAGRRSRPRPPVAGLVATDQIYARRAGHDQPLRARSPSRASSAS